MYSEFGDLLPVYDNWVLLPVCDNWILYQFMIIRSFYQFNELKRKCTYTILYNSQEH